MKISLKWLSDYIDVAEFFAKPQDLAALLTAAGLEVEGIENPAKQFADVVVGHILEKGKHPNADRLSLCQVSTGDGRIHQIVCGAQNHKQGDSVVVALPGAVLPGDFVIKLSKIRGVESGGMLCSQKELGLAEDSEGILILPSDAPIGKPFAEYMGMDDIHFELKVTPNRADCLSHFGLARELSTLLGRETKFPIEPFKEDGTSTKQTVGLEVRNAEACPRYDGRLVTGVKVGPSPDWLRKRLEAVGMNSINNIVDITNFVMLELGQPLHAFDVREIRGGRIVVENAKAGEVFVTLDGTELKMTGDELTIRDGERAVALAGVVGGKNSGIQDDTRDVFIEAAYFLPSVVRRTMRRFGIETDSGYRFSRGTNPEAVPLAMNRAAQLMSEIAGGSIAGEPHDFYPQPVRREPILITSQLVADRLGYEVEPAKFAGWMRRLGCEVTDRGGGSFAVLPPTFRWDLAIDMDLVEEYARLHGYQHIPETIGAFSESPTAHDPLYISERRLRGIWQAEGFLQAINYNFTGRKWQERVLGAVDRFENSGLRMDSEVIGLLNPLNEDINVMRLSLLPALIENTQRNSRHGNAFGRLFEIGPAHFCQGDGYAQETRLGLAAWGQQDDLWRKDGQIPLVLELKSHVENMLRSLVIGRWQWQQPDEAKNVPEFLHPGQTATLIVEGKPIGFIGTLHPVLQEELKIRETCAVAEFNLDRLLAGQPRSPRYKSIGKFPSVGRDIAFLMPKSLKSADVEREIRQAAGELLQEVRVFDVFEGGSLAVEQKSVAFRLIFQDLKGTLDDDRVNELRDKVINAVSQRFSISVR